jgi:hypothetical protein
MVVWWVFQMAGRMVESMAVLKVEQRAEWWDG